MTESTVTPPYTIKISKVVSVRYGYKDGHAEVGLTVIGLTKWQRFEADELPLAEKAFEEIKRWRQLPGDVRQRQGS